MSTDPMAPDEADAPDPMDLDTARRMVALNAPMPDAVHREVERTLLAALDQAAVDALVNQAKFKGMSVEDGAALLELESPREIVIAWVWAARQMLGDAPNYTETRIDFPAEAASMEVKAAGEVDRYVFTVQRAGKVTPHEARCAAEAERDEARAQLAAQQPVVEAATAYTDQPDLYDRDTCDALVAAVSYYRAARAGLVDPDETRAHTGPVITAPASPATR